MSLVEETVLVVVPSPTKSNLNTLTRKVRLLCTSLHHADISFRIPTTLPILIPTAVKNDIDSQTLQPPDLQTWSEIRSSPIAQDYTQLAVVIDPRSLYRGVL